ncbi:MAG: glycerol-3-phosphate 1-O-acyltransferase PlsY [Pseudomonadota bacterium]
MSLGLFLVLGYLLGSIPFGLIITRLAGKGDIRQIGSGNIGMTNVLRTGRKDLAALTLLGDAGKGLVAVELALLYGGLPAMMAAAIGAFLGHVFPVWLRFKGGKGVATYLGILIGFSGLAALAFAVLWIGTAAVTRFSSLSALVASLGAPIVLFIVGQPMPALVFAALTVLLYIKHRENIARLLAGTESRIGAK